MYICICNAITERQIIQAYNDGACSMRALRNKLGVADCCGRCAPAARDVLARCKTEQMGSATTTSVTASSGWLSPPSAAGEPA